MWSPVHAMAKDSWSRPSYDRSLFIGLVIYSLVLAGCFAVFQYFRERKFKADELNLQMQIINEHILDELAEPGSSCGDIDRHLPHRFEDLRVTVIDRTGRVIYDNTTDTIPESNHLDRSEIKQAIESGEGYSIRRQSSSTGLTYFYSAKAGGKWVVRTAVPYSVNLHQLLKADYGFLWFIGGIMLVMCVVGYFATRRVGLHIRRLNQFALRAERGERIIDDEPFPHDELGEISYHIVRLYARLQQAITDRDNEHRRALRQEYEKTRIKRQLTNNINHELKTPVASMQVCLETLLDHPDMAKEKQRDFIMRCLKANRRLGSLLSDVSTVTRLDDGGESIAVEDVDVAEVVADVCDELGPEAEKAGITIDNRIDCHSTIKGNRSLVDSIFRNLVSNAIAYSGGSRIELECCADEAWLSVTVGDNGHGVEDEHLPRLFERFYRVDKGRSRRAGGTGLGLAIVKNAVIWHGGAISVDRRCDGGLEFTFGFPIEGRC